MEGTYDVKLGSQIMGSVAVKKQGLYWQFDCRCSLCADVMYDLVVNAGDCWEKLGLLTPMNGVFGLCARLPMKRLGQGSPVFSLQPRHAKLKEQFLPVHPDEPFRYLGRLENAYLIRRDFRIGIAIKE